jgi:hypothetical protein
MPPYKNIRYKDEPHLTAHGICEESFTLIHLPVSFDPMLFKTAMFFISYTKAYGKFIPSPINSEL